MRLLLFFSLVIVSSSASSQYCTPTIPVTVNICNGILNDSITLSCLKNSRGLIVSDTNLIIESYTVTITGEGIGNKVYTASNQGIYFAPKLWQVINQVRPRCIVVFECIKARDKYDKNCTFVLQPLILDLK